MVMTPKGATLPPALAEAIGAYALCEGRTCRLEIDSPSRAVLISVDCQQCLPEAALLDRQPDGSWRPAGFGADSAPGSSTGLPAGSVEVRTVTARKIYVDGKPIGRAIE
jgi:hypothetical protein